MGTRFWMGGGDTGGGTGEINQMKLVSDFLNVESSRTSRRLLPKAEEIQGQWRPWRQVCVSSTHGEELNPRPG